jgi:hypothetical protein
MSDNPNVHEEYARSLTDTATVIMDTKCVDGYKDVCFPSLGPILASSVLFMDVPQILQFRHSLWSGPIKTCKHSISKIFPFDDNSNEIMLYGTVDYVLKNGKDVMVDWACRAVLTEERERCISIRFIWIVRPWQMRLRINND